jgi:hypothetical protein
MLQLLNQQNIIKCSNVFNIFSIFIFYYTGVPKEKTSPWLPYLLDDFHYLLGAPKFARQLSGAMPNYEKNNSVF